MKFLTIADEKEVELELPPTISIPIAKRTGKNIRFTKQIVSPGDSDWDAAIEHYAFTRGLTIKPAK